MGSVYFFGGKLFPQRQELNSRLLSMSELKKVAIILINAITFLASVGVLKADQIPERYEPHLPGYKACMVIFNQEKRMLCLENSIEGLLRLGLHRNGTGSDQVMRNMAISNCGTMRSTDTLLCKVRTIDFWIH